MARGYPPLTALLGLLAIAGYQHRDKIAEYLRSAGGPSHASPNPATPAGSSPAIPGNLGGLLAGTSIGDLLGGGLRDLVNAFKQNGQGEAADSWVGTGANKPIAPPELEKAIGPDVLDTLTQQTGLSRAEILARLSKNLPQAVDRYTPEGRLPSSADFPRS